MVARICGGHIIHISIGLAMDICDIGPASTIIILPLSYL